MKNKLILAFLMLFGVLCSELKAQDENAWQMFEKVEFKDIYVEKYFSYASLPDPETPYTKEIDGKKLTIKGHYIPVMGDIIIVSKYPYANCFFCGGAGLESIVEVRLKNGKNPNFDTDQKLEVTGTLKVNTTDWQQVGFILEEAEIIN